MKLQKSIRSSKSFFSKQQAFLSRYQAASLLFLVLFCGALSLGFLFLKKDIPSQTYALQWRGYARTERAVTGHLLQLTNNEKNLSVYIAVDRVPVSSEVFLADGWTYQPISEEEIWNPRECAKMPISVQERGDVFMLDTRRERDGTYSSFLIQFARGQNFIRMADIDAMNWKGMFLYEDKGGNPYFFGLDGSTLHTYSLTPDRNDLSITLVRMLADGDSLSFSRTENRLPVISILNQKSLETSRFLYDQEHLAPYTGKVQKMAFSFLNDNESISDLKNELRSHYFLDDAYATQVDYRADPIFALKSQARIYAYVLGSFKSINTP